MTINDNPEVRYWAVEAANRGGGFLQKIAGAALLADVNNYPIIKPALLQLIMKYPEYQCCKSGALSVHGPDCKLKSVE